MKLSEIKVGHIYHDGKQGLREVVDVNRIQSVVRYRLLAAKNERQLSQNNWSSVLGLECNVSLQGFAAWAKSCYTQEDGRKLLLRLQAAKIKLSPGEIAFVQGVQAEIEGQTLGAPSVISYDHTEGRAVAGLERKGLLRRMAGGEAELLPMGAALISGLPV